MWDKSTMRFRRQLEIDRVYLLAGIAFSARKSRIDRKWTCNFEAMFYKFETPPSRYKPA